MRPVEPDLISGNHEPARTTVNVQFGCGLCNPTHWVNFDGSPRLRAELNPVTGPLIGLSVGRLFPRGVEFGDIVRGLPVPESSVDNLYSSHVLEHLPRNDVPTALANCHRMLKPDGVFRLIVPDFAWRAQRYCDAQRAEEPTAADQFINDCYLGVRGRSTTLLARLRSLLGNSGHLWMYDFAAMKALLEEAGFVSIRRCRMGDSDRADYNLVEQADRFMDQGYPELAIEARKPGPDQASSNGHHRETWANGSPRLRT